MHSIVRGVIGILVTPVAFVTIALAEVPSAPSSLASAAPCSGPEVAHAIGLGEAVGTSIDAAPQLIMAQADQTAAEANVTAATAPLVPSMQFNFQDQRYNPDNQISPVVVIGNTVLGGGESKTAYGSLSLTWNVLNSGRDWAARQAARAVNRAAKSAVGSQLADTVAGVLQAFADLYEAQIDARTEESAVQSLKAIQTRAEERYGRGQGTTVAIGQARAAAFDAEQSFAKACHGVGDKAAALAQAIGVHVPLPERLAAADALPMPAELAVTDADLEKVIDGDPAVVAAKEKVNAADEKHAEATRAFGPSVSLAIRRDYLKQSIDSFGEANRHLAPYDYQVGLYIQQPLLPFISEAAGVSKASAELRKAQAQYLQARLDTEAKLRGALNARREAYMSYAAARSALQESERVLTLTDSLYRAGRADLDDVEHARIDRNKAARELDTFESRRALTEWLALRSLEPEQFAQRIFHQLNLPELQPDPQVDSQFESALP